MKDRTSPFPLRTLDTQLLHMMGLLIMLGDIMVLCGLAWGPRGLVLALVLQATMLILSAPWHLVRRR